jgi:hypothetical protein
MNVVKSIPGKHTKSLFYETSAYPELVRYTLKAHDHMGFPSLRRLYLEADDPTEYEFVKKYLEGIDHWDDLCACKWFKPHIDSWRRELELRLKSQALLRIREEAMAGGRNSLQANRFLVDKGWETKPGQRGRPSKDEIRREAERQVTAERQVSDDWDRLKAN